MDNALKGWQKWGRPEWVQRQALLRVGIVEGRAGRLSRSAERVALAIQAENGAQPFRGGLKNEPVASGVLEERVAFGSLGALRPSRWPIQIDGSPLNEDLNGLRRMRVEYRKRASPVLGPVLTHPGHSTFKERTPVWGHGEAVLAAGCRGLILADRTFGQRDRLPSLRLHHWAFCRRLKGTPVSWPTPGLSVKRKPLAPAAGSHSVLTERRLSPAQS